MHFAQTKHGCDISDGFDRTGTPPPRRARPVARETAATGESPTTAVDLCSRGVRGGRRGVGATLRDSHPSLAGDRWVEGRPDGRTRHRTSESGRRERPNAVLTPGSRNWFRSPDRSNATDHVHGYMSLSTDVLDSTPSKFSVGAFTGATGDPVTVPQSSASSAAPSGPDVRTRSAV